jgi:hypothetical protein
MAGPFAMHRGVHLTAHQACMISTKATKPAPKLRVLGAILGELHVAVRMFNLRFIRSLMVVIWASAVHTDALHLFDVSARPRGGGSVGDCFHHGFVLLWLLLACGGRSSRLLVLRFSYSFLDFQRLQRGRRFLPSRLLL